MSGWTVLTARGLRADEYVNAGVRGSMYDMVATMDADHRVRRLTTWHNQVYAYLNCERYDFEFAEDFIREYKNMIKDAVVLGANDTTDMGTACYYPDPTGGWTDKYNETEQGYVGELALAVMTSRHGIVARDPFHNKCGLVDDSYVEGGEVKL